MEGGQFSHWLAVLTATLFGPLLEPHDGARVASGVLMAATLAFVHLSARELYGRTGAIGAVLTLLGCLGLLAHAHEVLAEISMLAGQALAWYGIALAPREPRPAGWLLRAGPLLPGLRKGISAGIWPAGVGRV